MTETAIIGGTGLTSLEGLEIVRREVVNTPYGEASGPLVHGELQGHRVVFLPRHGSGHTIPPHKINYRANIWALKSIGVEKVIAINAVGGIAPEFSPGRLAFPDQIIDYTWSRINTFFEEGLTDVVHIDFAHPYCEELRALLVWAAGEAGVDAVNFGTYGATQGPRLETIAEIDRLERDGCHMVGMTGMPEAALAREQDLCYAACAVVANWAAGRGEGEQISMALIKEHLREGMAQVRRLLSEVVPRL